MHYHEDHSHVVNRNTRYGLILFAVYVALYGGFVYLAVFHAPLMGAVMPGGANLAIVYGFALIIAALVLALLYVFLCGRAVPQSAAGDAEARAHKLSNTDSH